MTLAADMSRAGACAPLLLLCWLCCWPDDDNSDTSSSGKPHRKHKPVGSQDSNSGQRRKSSELFKRKIASSAVSLHLPSTSGHVKQPLSGHRSHEEIGHRRRSHHGVEEESRYHSAPSVIDEVLHRRDWERSSKELYIPLKPQRDDPDYKHSPNSESSANDVDSPKETHENITVKTCKKHYTNIKSSKNKERHNDDVKDEDATENPGFYIGDVNSKDNDVWKNIQLMDEAPKCKEFRVFELDVDEEEIDRSGAMHHTIESRISILPSASGTSIVEPVGYDGAECYLVSPGPAARPRPLAALVADEGRARHASDGDILAPGGRPQSGAFSESDLDFDLELSGLDERPPTYDELHQYVTRTRERKETAI